MNLKRANAELIKIKGLNSVNFVNYILSIYNRLNISNKSRPIACPFYTGKKPSERVAFLVYIPVEIKTHEFHLAQVL